MLGLHSRINATANVGDRLLGPVLAHVDRNNYLASLGILWLKFYPSSGSLFGCRQVLAIDRNPDRALGNPGVIQRERQ